MFPFDFPFTFRRKGKDQRVYNLSIKLLQGPGLCASHKKGGAGTQFLVLLGSRTEPIPYHLDLQKSFERLPFLRRCNSTGPRASTMKQREFRHRLFLEKNNFF
jgi:hypothetical protein